MGIRGREALSDLILDEAQLRQMIPSVKSAAALGALGRDDAVALLPAAQRRRRAPQHLRHGPDAVERHAGQHAVGHLNDANSYSAMCRAFRPSIRPLAPRDLFKTSAGPVSFVLVVDATSGPGRHRPTGLTPATA